MRLRPCLFPSALLCAHLALPADAAAQTPRPVTVDVVVTATASPVPASTIGRTVTTITRDDLDRLGLSSVIDALRFVPGVDVRARGGRDVQTDFSLRGATFGQALVLLDGMRLNDSQSGHHNGEIPAPVVAIDRIEVVSGPASAVHGADALGGTIQVITRTGSHAGGDLTASQHGTLAAQASMSGRALPARLSLTAWGSRSDGFMFDRDWGLGGAALKASLPAGVALDGRHARRAFGANGFYGNSPSKEWTTQTLLGVRQERTIGAWTMMTRAAYRRHTDRFRWDINRPGFAENVHATDALEGTLSAGRMAGPSARVTIGAGGGADWIDSSNLGDHTYTRAHAFAETLWTPTASFSTQLGARIDHYSAFGTAVSPSASASLRLSPTVRLRASAARAFRIPTFTERFYTDPAHQASAQLDPERGWSLDGGVDLTLGRVSLGVTPFIRWDDDVIDWVRESTTQRWRTTNVRDVTTTGLEVQARRTWGRALISAHYTGLRVDAPRLGLLSKYVLEYARHSAGLAAAAPVARRVTAALTVDLRDRVDGQQYVLVGARLTRAWSRWDLFVEGSNLLDEAYREIAGVPMPGRWLGIGVRVR
jgi:iron complex outermembrane receptor protein